MVHWMRLSTVLMLALAFATAFGKAGEVYGFFW
jgi:hypothetical protein